MNVFEILLSLLSLTLLEIVLGIDNLVFLSLLTEKLPREQRKKARFWGLTFAWMTRLLLLAAAVWIVKLNTTLFSLGSISFSGRGLFLLIGGLFLIVKATQEIHNELNEPVETKKITSEKVPSVYFVVVQIGVMDIIFSLDSVLTAVGLTNHFEVMAIAISIAIIVMLYASEAVSDFIERYPTLKMLALSFLLLIGTLLIADGFNVHVPRAYLYFSMFFSLSVEALNLTRQSRVRKKRRHD